MDTKYLEIIKAPVVTEKSTKLNQDEQKYVFKVDVRSNKTEVKQMIEKIFNVKVEKVNIMNIHPKDRRVGKYTGKTNRYKKAIIKLAKGSTISFD